MVWLIVAAAVAVVGLASFAASGRFGEMPEPISDRPKGYFPELPFGEEFLAELRLPRVAVGYDCDQVMEFCRSSLQEPPAERPLFDVISGGYDMQFVDAVIDRVCESVVPLADEAPRGVAATSGDQAEPELPESPGLEVMKDAE